MFRDYSVYRVPVHPAFRAEIKRNALVGEPWPGGGPGWCRLYEGMGIGQRGQLLQGRPEQPVGVAFLYLALGIDGGARRTETQSIPIEV